MPYTLKQARKEQDEARKSGDDDEVIFWSGYLAAMIDHDYPPLFKSNDDSIRPLVFQPGVTEL